MNISIELLIDILNDALNDSYDSDNMSWGDDHQQANHRVREYIEYLQERGLGAVYVDTRNYGKAWLDLETGSF